MTLQHTAASARTPTAGDGAGTDALELQIHERLLQDLDLRQMDQLPEAERYEQVKNAVTTILAELAPGVAGVTREQIVTNVVNDSVGLGPLQPLLDNPDISEIMINGPDRVFIEENGRLFLSDVRFRDVNHIRRIADRIVQPIGRRLDEASPLVDARLADGSRVNITIPPVSPESPSITIRKFQTDKFGIPDYLKLGVMTPQLAGFMRASVIAKANIVISGGTGSGKTTMLNAISTFIPDDERLVSIEDPIEIQLRQTHVIKLEARPAGVGGVGAITQGDLVKNALRMRPDRIVMGECRREEA
ncbi:MAG: ATPase, T2SS/T4P/T4SS family, partial [Dehalococcoidia bacterium]